MENQKKKKNTEVEKLEKEKLELSDKILRLTAEMQNMSKRFDQEKQNLLKYDGEDVIKDVLPILDNFERAISLDDENLKDELSKFLEGFKLIYTSLKKVLTDAGVKEIDAIDKEFDPNCMEAIMTGHIDGKNANVVIEVLQKGYIYNDKVIRVAMVKVNK